MEVKPTQKWPCRICGKIVEHPDFFMETTLCEDCKNKSSKHWTAAEIERAKDLGRELAEFLKKERRSETG